MNVYTLQPPAKDDSEESALRHAAARVLGQSMRTTAEYVLEVNPHDGDPLRQHIAGLATAAENGSTAADFDKAHASFRGELRTYRDRSAKELQRIREEIATAAHLLRNLAENVADAGNGHGETVRNEVLRLRQSAEADDLTQLRGVVSSASDVILRSCEELQRTHQATVSQLRDEIRALHLQVEQEKRSGLTDAHTGAWNRTKLDNRLHDLERVNQPFCVLLVGVSNLSNASARHPSRCVREALRAMLARLAGMTGSDGVAGRWNEDVFAVIFDVPASALPVTQRELQFRLDGPYAVQDNGTSYTVDLAVKTAIVARPRGADESEFGRLLRQAVASVTPE